MTQRMLVYGDPTSTLPERERRPGKRVLDLGLSLALLALLSPLLMVLAVAVRLETPGPAFFAQRRVGEGGKVFVCYKLRTMHDGAEGLQPKLEAYNEAEPPLFKIERDPRVTRVGRFLRRWSLDELPQLWNVLRGEMSLVGPRPLPVRDFRLMGGGYEARFSVLPGITGYWQVRGRGKMLFKRMMELDLYYVRNASLRLDLCILLRTVAAVVIGRGAY